MPNSRQLSGVGYEIDKIFSADGGHRLRYMGVWRGELRFHRVFNRRMSPGASRQFQCRLGQQGSPGFNRQSESGRDRNEFRIDSVELYGRPAGQFRYASAGEFGRSRSSCFQRHRRGQLEFGNRPGFQWTYREKFELESQVVV